MYNYNELLFDSPIPFIIAKYKDNNLKIIHKNTKFEDLNYNDIENNNDIKILIDLALESNSKEIDIKYIDKVYNILAKKYQKKK